MVRLLSPEDVLGEWAYLAGAVGAAAVAWRGARRSAARSTATLVALGVLLSAAGDVLWQLQVWADDVAPDVSIADVGWLGAYALISIALLRVLREGRDRRTEPDGWIDIAVVIVVAMLVQWELSLHELVTDHSVAASTRFVWALYPALDVVLLALALRTVVARRLNGRAAVLLAGGAACWLVSDFAFTLSGEFGAWLDAGWLAGAMLLGASTWQRLDVAAHDRSEPDHVERPRYGRIALALLPLLAPALVEIVGYFRGTDPNPVPLAIAAVVLVALTFLRTARILRSEAYARSLVRSQQRYAHAIAMNSSDAVAVVDAAGVVLNDSRLAALVGYPEVDIRGAKALELVAGGALDEVRVVMARSLREPGETFEAEAKVLHRDGHEMWLSVRLVNLLDDPDVGGIVMNIHDVTARKQAEHDLAHQAFHDGLTGLANRALFADRVEQALRRNVRTGADPAVLFLDLDGFKKVNDSLGHGPGDDLLREVASRLVGAVRAGDTVARLGGDEFAILIEESHRPVDEAEAVAERILQSLASPVALAERTVTTSASIGIAVGDADATAASLLRDADVAMYRAKTAGKGQWVVHDPEMRAAAMERLRLESDLVGALDAGQLRLVYQPVIQLEGERVVGFEALLRWDHPTLGVVMPDRFIPLVEENSLIVPIGAWVLEEACRKAAEWQREYPEHRALTIAVNISGRQIASPHLVAHVSAALAQSGLDPSTLVLEITETALVQDPGMAASRLGELRELGVRLAIDDFGTGYSSLSYLRQFPVDILKIDRSFISGITNREQVPAIVRALLDLGRTLQLETVAEGVELAVQRDRLRDEQCEFAQGYLFARPMDPADAEALIMRLPFTTPDPEPGQGIRA